MTAFNSPRLRTLSNRWSLRKRGAKRSPGRKASLTVERLELRDLPATLTSAANLLTFDAGAGVNNSLAVTISGTDFVFTDTAETITTAIAGATGSGTNTVTVPVAGV